jgi:pentatricopeptide repeat protein
MKNLILFALLLGACQNTNTTAIAAPPYTQQLAALQAENLLHEIQQKAYNSFVQAMMTQKDEQLAQLKVELANLYQKKNQNLIQYWRAYTSYYHAIFALKMAKKDLAEQYTEEGIEWLEDLKNKNSEDYALLALLKSFSIQFKMGIKAPFISASVKKDTERAIQLDKENLRGYYVYASSDFYTPEQYGGGKETEEYLLKAIALPAQKIQNAFLPSWGKEEAYEMLIRLYIKKQKWEEAKKYFQEGIAAFPNSYSINQLASKLVGK